MKKKLIIITGISGVGKSAVSNILYEHLADCFYLEGDKCGIMNTPKFTPENETLLLKNISHVLNNYIKNTGSRYIIFNWDIHNKNSIHRLLSLLNLQDVIVYKINLICSRVELINRINKDIKNGIRDMDEITSINNKIDLYKELADFVIDTTEKTPLEAAEVIMEIIK